MKKTTLLLFSCFSFLVAISLHGQNIPFLNEDDQNGSPLMMLGENEKKLQLQMPQILEAEQI